MCIHGDKAQQEREWVLGGKPAPIIFIVTDLVNNARVVVYSSCDDGSNFYSSLSSPLQSSVQGSHPF